MSYLAAFMVWPAVSIVYSTVRSVRATRSITQQLQVFSQTLSK